MRKLSFLLLLFLVSFVGYASTDSNKIEGLWEWSNSPFDYPAYIEFQSDGNMYIHKMKSYGMDSDRFIWNLDENTVYYTRPAADEKVVNTMYIIRNDGKTLILKDSDGDMWLKRVDSSK